MSFVKDYSLLARGWRCSARDAMDISGMCLMMVRGLQVYVIA